MLLNTSNKKKEECYELTIVKKNGIKTTLEFDTREKANKKAFDVYFNNSEDVERISVKKIR